MALTESRKNANQKMTDAELDELFKYNEFDSMVKAYESLYK